MPRSKRRPLSSRTGSSREALPKPGRPQPGRALFQQVKDYILENIQSGRWRPGDQVPSELQLVETMGVSRMTANRALRELTEEGRLVRRQGVGTFVIDRKPLAGLLEVRSIADEIARAGGRHAAQVHLLAREQAPDWVAEALGLARRSHVFHSLLVHLNNHVPVQLAERWVNPAVAPHYLEQDFTQITPNQYLMEVAPIQEAQHVLEAILPDQDAQRLLQIGPHEPCLLLNRRTWALGMAATQNRFIYPGSRYRLGGRFETRGGSSPRRGL